MLGPKPALVLGCSELTVNDGHNVREYRGHIWMRCDSLREGVDERANKFSFLPDQKLVTQSIDQSLAHYLLAINSPHFKDQFLAHIIGTTRG